MEGAPYRIDGVPGSAAIVLLILCALEAAGQVVDFPCVPRFRADPSYIHVSEASGGQILLLDRTEIAKLFQKTRPRRAIKTK